MFAPGWSGVRARCNLGPVPVRTRQIGPRLKIDTWQPPARPATSGSSPRSYSFCVGVSNGSCARHAGSPDSGRYRGRAAADRGDAISGGGSPAPAACSASADRPVPSSQAGQPLAAAILIVISLGQPVPPARLTDPGILGDLGDRRGALKSELDRALPELQWAWSGHNGHPSLWPPATSGRVSGRRGKVKTRICGTQGAVPHPRPRRQPHSSHGTTAEGFVSRVARRPARSRAPALHAGGRN